MREEELNTQLEQTQSQLFAELEEHKMTKARFAQVQSQLSAQTEAISTQNEKVDQLLQLYTATKSELDELKAQKEVTTAKDKHPLELAFERGQEEEAADQKDQMIRDLQGKVLELEEKIRAQGNAHSLEGAEKGKPKQEMPVIEEPAEVSELVEEEREPAAVEEVVRHEATVHVEAVQEIATELPPLEEAPT